jgi:hypothetical protein
MITLMVEGGRENREKKLQTSTEVQEQTVCQARATINHWVNVNGLDVEVLV